MSEFDKKMEEIFDVTPVETNYVATSDQREMKVINDETDYQGDLSDAYSQSKDNLQDLIDSGNDAMNELLQIAKAGQHPRAFEVYATLLKNMGELNDKLLETQKKIRDIEGIKKQSGPKTNIENALFVGSTAELQKFLKSNGDK
jgi:uncharacterized protein YukE